MVSSRILAIVMLTLLFAAIPAFGFVEPTVRVAEDFVGTAGGGVLTLTITASRDIPSAELTLEPLTALVAPIQSTYQLRLPAHVPVLINIPLRRQGSDAFGVVRMAIEGADGGAVELLYFVTGERQTLRMISASEFAALVEEKQRIEHEERAERRAAELFERLIESGRRPGTIDDPKSAFDRAWNPAGQ